jgi:ribosomal protein L35
MKTNKSFLKRLKLTKNSKIIARSKGQNHFNSKESRRAQLSKKAEKKCTLLLLIKKK